MAFKSLLLSLVFYTICLISSTPYTTLAYHSNVANKWSYYYPNIPMPSIVSQRISPLSHGEENALLSLLHKQTLGSHLDLFCKTADLFCRNGNTGKVFPDSNNCYRCYAPHHTPKIRDVPPGVFFRESLLKNGMSYNMGELRASFPARSFLPQPIASLLPLKNSEVVFKSLKDTIVRNLVNSTASLCESHIPTEQYQMKCVTSIDELLQFPVEVFNNDKRLQMFVSKSEGGSLSSVVLDNIHTLLKEDKTSNLLSCHEVFYPYMVMYCHTTLDVQMYKADLVHPKTKKVINEGLIAVCHRDTSYWDPNHIAFAALKVKPGESEVCHWSTPTTLTWVHMDSTIV